MIITDVMSIIIETDFMWMFNRQYIACAMIIFIFSIIFLFKANGNMIFKWFYIAENVATQGKSDMLFILSTRHKINSFHTALTPVFIQGTRGPT